MIRSKREQWSRHTVQCNNKYINGMLIQSQCQIVVGTLPARFRFNVQCAELEMPYVLSVGNLFAPSSFHNPVINKSINSRRLNWINFGRETNFEFAFVGNFHCIWKLFPFHSSNWLIGFNKIRNGKSVRILNDIFIFTSLPSHSAELDTINFPRKPFVYFNFRFLWEPVRIVRRLKSSDRAASRTSFNSQILFICHRFCRLFASLLV